MLAVSDSRLRRKIRMDRRRDRVHSCAGHLNAQGVVLSGLDKSWPDDAELGQSLQEALPASRPSRTQGSIAYSCGLFSVRVSHQAARSTARHPFNLGVGLTGAGNFLSAISL